jgi:hypothetical protein
MFSKEITEAEYFHHLFIFYNRSPPLLHAIGPMAACSVLSLCCNPCLLINTLIGFDYAFSLLEFVARAGSSTLGVSSSVEEAQLMSRQHFSWWGPLKST